MSTCVRRLQRRKIERKKKVRQDIYSFTFRKKTKKLAALGIEPKSQENNNYGFPQSNVLPLHHATWLLV